MGNFLRPVIHLSTKRGLLPFKACGSRYHSRVSMRVQRNNHPVSTRTVGVKVNADNTEIYVFP